MASLPGTDPSIPIMVRTGPQKRHMTQDSTALPRGDYLPRALTAERGDGGAAFTVLDRSRPLLRRAMNRTLECAILACLLALWCQDAAAQTSQFQGWPEIDTYVNLNSRTRVSFFAARTDDGLTPVSIQIGPNFDIALKPFLRRRLRTSDESAQKYLMFRVGYRYGTGPDQPSEHRAIAEITPRFPLPWAMLLSERNRADFRFIDGEFSWRYRPRLMVERSFAVKRLSVTPYARGELFYDSRYELWNQNAYCVGTTVTIHQGVDIEPFYEHRNNSRSSPAHINAFGLTLSLYFRLRHNQ